MPNPIEFYFDLSSPYGYIASEKIDALAAKYSREVTWRPIMLGVVFKTTGGAPLASIPLKWPYSARDIARTAKFHGVEYRPPSIFPIATVSPCRAFYWMDAKEPMRAKRLARALYRAYFVEGVDISKAENTVTVCEKSGLKADEVRAGLADQTIKDRLRSEVDKAIALGVFGSPYIIVDGEPFWGSDRLDQIDRWLNTGGW
jgi:2-hydroxychromene-2-carboxylate isomerase